ncbi:MAG: Mu-like prophage major head subunit gpT family protein [Sulfitobacter sp.]
MEPIISPQTLPRNMLVDVRPSGAVLSYPQPSGIAFRALPISKGPPHMLVNAQTLDLVFQGFKTVYTDAFLKAEPNWNKIAMQSTSVGADETYGWMGQFPQLREWLGPRIVHNLEAHGFKIVNPV